MQTHEMRLHQLPFDQIKSGIKTFEARIYDEKRRELSIGDHILFKLREHEDVRFTSLIADIQVFPSFIQMYESIPPELFGWDTTTTPESAAIEMAKYYTEVEEKEFGVAAIQLKLIDSPANGLYYA